MPCVATGVDFLNTEKEYTRTNYKANQTSNWIRAKDSIIKKCKYANKYSPLSPRSTEYSNKCTLYSILYLFLRCG